MVMWVLLAQATLAGILGHLVVREARYIIQRYHPGDGHHG